MNFEAFLKDVLEPVLDRPDELRIEVSTNGKKRDVLIIAAQKDRGRIIGKNGRMISSLRTLCKAAGEKENLMINVELFDEDEARSPKAESAEAR